MYLLRHKSVLFLLLFVLFVILLCVTILFNNQKLPSLNSEALDELDVIPQVQSSISNDCPDFSYVDKDGKTLDCASRRKLAKVMKELGVKDLAVSKKQVPPIEEFHEVNTTAPKDKYKKFASKYPAFSTFLQYLSDYFFVFHSWSQIRN
jgi:hypothetical protein